MSKKAFARLSETVTAPLAYWSGLRFYRQHRWQKAAALFELATQQRPNHAPSHFKLGMCHYRQQIWHKAASSITKAIRLNPSRIEWIAQKKRADRECAKANPAKSTLPAGKQEALVRALLANDHHNPDLHSNLALTLRKQGKWWQEVEALKYATTLNEQTPKWHYRLGEAHEMISQFREAAQSYSKAVLLTSGKAAAEWHYREGYCWERAASQDPAARDAAARAYEQAIEKDKTLNAKRFGIGVFHQSRGYWEQAIVAYAEKWKQPPWDEELAYRIALSHERCDQFSHAAVWYRRALALNLKNPNWHYRLGFCLEQVKHYAEAAKAYKYAILQSNDSKPNWHYRLGHVLQQANKHEEALNAFLQIKSIPNNSSSHRPNGDGDRNNIDSEESNYVHSLINYSFMTMQLVDHLSRDATDSRVWFQFGNALEAQGDWERAVDAYRQAIKRSTVHNPDWYYRLAFTQEKSKFLEAASATLSELQTDQLSINNEFEKINTKEKHAIQKLYTYYRTSLPISDKTILFESFDGANISCNPNALFREMLNNPKYKDWEYIWTVNDYSSIPEELKSDKRVFFVRKESDPYLRALASCSHLVNNVVFRPYFHRRPEQRYLATWHGTPLKTLGKDQQQKFFDHRRAQRNFLQSTHIISPNPHTTAVFLESYQLKHLYAGKIAELGNARIDLTLNTTIERKATILESLGITDNLPVVLYSPTWRGDIKNAFIDKERLESDIRKLTSAKYHLLFKGHSLTEEIIDKADLKCLRPPKNLDSNELLSVVDIIITDYSSIFFDFIPKKKPIIYYAYDEETYRRERGLYFTFNELPGKKFTDADELALHLDALVDNVAIDESQYNVALNLFCTADNGKSSERALKFFMEDSDESVVNSVDPKQSNNVLIAVSANDLHHTGKYVVALAKAIKESGLVPTLLFSPNEFEPIKSKDQFFRELDDIGAIYLPRCGIPNMLHRTRQQYSATRPIVGLGYPRAIRSALDFAFGLELERLAGPKPFKYIFDCSNGNAYFHDLFSALESQEVVIQKFPNGIANAVKKAASTPHLPASGEFLHSQDTAAPSTFQTVKSARDILDRIDETDLPAGHYEDLDDIRSKIVIRLDNLTLMAQGYRFGLSISLPGFDSSKIKIQQLCFQQRKRVGNEDESLLIKVTSASFANNKHELLGEISFEKVNVPLLYWELEICIGYRNSLGAHNEFVAQVNAIDERLKETIDEYPLRFGRKLFRTNGPGTVIYPYINANDRISFLNRESDSYDSALYRAKEIAAKMIYSCAKRYWDSKDIWLVFEKNSKTAQDNGFYFFKDAAEKQPNVYFVIDKNANDFGRTSQFKHQIIKFMSIRHMVYLLAASTIISSEARAHGYAWRRVFGEYRKALFNKRYVFLQHGVTALKNTKNIFSRRNKAFAADLFVVTSPKEARIVSERLGYSNEQLILSSFARWHNFTDTSRGKNEIFLMPTWRNWLEEISDGEFLSSAYFHAYKNLLESPDLLATLDRHNFRLNFILHPKLAHHLTRFESHDTRITIADTSKTTVRDFLSSAKILITDYSSVAWDFLYLRKPVIFYHFDRIEYEKHQGSYIDLTRDLPGEVASNAADLIRMIDRACGCYEEFSSRALSFHTDFFGDDISTRNDEGKVLEAVRALGEIPLEKKKIRHVSGTTWHTDKAVDSLRST